MQSKYTPFVASLLAAGLPIAHSTAATFYKANNNDPIAQTTSWWTSVAGPTNPTSIGTSDTLWLGSSGQGADRILDLGSDLTIGALRLDNNGGSQNYNSTINAGNTLTLTGNNDYTGGLAQGIVLNSSAGGSLTIHADITLANTQRWVSSRNLTVTGNVNLAANDLTLWSAGGTTEISGIISGSGGIIRDHSSGGVARLTGINTYTGNTTINQGILEIAGAGSLGAGSYAGAISVGSGDTLHVNSSADQTFSGVMSGDGNLIKGNSGTLTMTANNTYAGTTTINGGILQIGNGGSSGLLGTGDVTIADGAELIINRNSNYNGIDAAITGSGTLRFRGGNGSWLRFLDNTSGGFHLDMGASSSDRGDIVFHDIWGDGTTLPKFSVASLSGYGNFRSDWGSGAGNRTISVNQDIDTEYHGRINQNNNGARSINLEKLGSGTLTLTNNHNYKDTFVGGTGTLQVGNGGTTGALGSGIVTIDSGAQLTFNRSNTFTVANTFAGLGTINKKGTGRMLITGDNSATSRIWNFSGTGNGDIGFNNAEALGASGSKITVQDNGSGSFFFSTNGVTSDANLEIGSNATLSWNGSTGSTYTGTGLISGAGLFNKQSGSTLILTSNNTHTGGTRIENGTLQVGNGGTSGSLGSGAINIQNASTLRFNRSDDFSVANDISGNGSLVKEGAGKLTLTGTNYYTGNTVVNAGSLYLNGSMGNSDITVNNGATLGGSGVITGATAILDGATLDPGNSPGLLTFNGDLTLALNAFINFELDGTQPSTPSFSDHIAVGGALTFGGQINIIDIGSFAGATAGQEWTLFDYSGGSLSFAGADLDSSYTFNALPSLSGGLEFKIIDDVANQNLNLAIVTAIPEPSSLSLIGLGAITLILRRRR
ncbi:beta strand repeat-containing protein [Rubritalea tangerina]|uniref:Beta strand repeat-containing protein n=2 Tax=Rubritalea tangerina TaxID=430798 RepID=A0ABW4Z758_9BACT